MYVNMSTQNLSSFGEVFSFYKLAQFDRRLVIPTPVLGQAVISESESDTDSTISEPPERTGNTQPVSVIGNERLENEDNAIFIPIASTSQGSHNECN